MGDTGEPQAGVCPQRHALGRLRALPESLKKRTKERTASSTVAKSPTNSALQGQTGPTRANDSLMTSTNQNKAWMEKIFDPLSPTSAATSPAALQRRQEESLLPPLSANSSMSSTFGSSSLSHASAGGSYIIKPYTPREQTPRSSPSPRRNSARTPMTPRGAGDRNRTDDAELSLQKDRSLTHSLNLIIDALSYNEMTLDGGFAAFDSDGDGRISLGEFIASVDDLQLELDASMIRLMHRKLDIDCDGFINRQEWIKGLSLVQSGDTQTHSHLRALDRALEMHSPSRQEANIQGVSRAHTDVQAMGGTTPSQVPLGLAPAAQARLAFEVLCSRLAAAIQMPANSVKNEISEVLHELNKAIEFDIGRIADREREQQIQWEKEKEALCLDRNREAALHLSLKTQFEAVQTDLGDAQNVIGRLMSEKETMQLEVVELQRRLAESQRALEEVKSTSADSIAQMSAEIEKLSADSMANMSAEIEKMEKVRAEMETLRSALEAEKKAHTESKRILSKTQVEGMDREKVWQERADKAEKSLKGMKEEMAHLKAQRSKTPSDTENSFVGESRASSHRRRQSSSSQDDKVDRTDKSERSERRSRRSKDAALEEVSRLKGELAAFKACYSDLQRELQRVSGDLAMIDSREQAVKTEIEERDAEIRMACLEIENLREQLHSLQVLREEDQREEKWAHSGVSRESHEAIVKMLKEKETDIQELRLRLSLAEKGPNNASVGVQFASKGWSLPVMRNDSLTSQLPQDGLGFNLKNTGLVGHGGSITHRGSSTGLGMGTGLMVRDGNSAVEHRLSQVLEENRVIEAAFQSYRREAEDHLMRAHQSAEEQRSVIAQLEYHNVQLRSLLALKEEEAADKGSIMLKLTSANKQSQDQLIMLQTQLGRMNMDKKQLEEAIGVVADVITRSTPCGPGAPAVHAFEHTNPI